MDSAAAAVDAGIDAGAVAVRCANRVPSANQLATAPPTEVVSSAQPWFSRCDLIGLLRDYLDAVAGEVTRVAS